LRLLLISTMAALSASLTVWCAADANADIKNADIKHDTQLRSMLDELARAKTLQLNDLDKPYFISFASNDSEQATIAASLGGLTASNYIHVRQPTGAVRVGNYKFDNTNSIYSRSLRLGLLPIDDDYQAVRTTLWLATDALYKTAADEITRKRTALRETSSPDLTPDFAPQAPLQLLNPATVLKFDRPQWEAEIRRLSSRFVAHPDVAASSVRVLAAVTTYRLVNTEGTVIRIAEDVADLEIRANGLAPDGSRVWNHEYVSGLQPSEFPSEAELVKRVDEVATQVEGLEKAPLMEDYTGPVLFEREAAAQLVAEMMADAPRLRRKPVAPPGANVRTPLESVWATHIGGKVAPDWLTLIDDPTRETFDGKTLSGAYQVDDEGVPAAKVTIVENGVFKNFLLSRVPVRSYNASNGHGRLPEAYGDEAAVVGNLFVQVSQKTPEAEMKTRLIEREKAAGLKYGILIRRLDFPSTANLQDLEDMARDMQKDGYARTMSAPLLAFRVYPDGREELVRGARFHEFSAKNLRDLEAASDAPYVLNYVNNGSSFNIMGSSQEMATSAVICPSLLIDEVELGHAQSESTKPPIVPPPALVANQ
jgi:TldD protein